jgi:hypothetical protein
MPERGILCFKSALGLEERGNQVQEEKYQRDHRGRRYAILSPDQYRMKFSAHTGPPGSAVTITMIGWSRTQSDRI